MVILYDAIKTIQNGVFAFFLKNKNLFLFKKTKKFGLKKTGGLFFLKKRVFLNHDCLSKLCDFPLIVRSGTSHVTITLIWYAQHT